MENEEAYFSTEDEVFNQCAHLFINKVNAYKANNRLIASLPSAILGNTNTILSRYRRILTFVTENTDTNGVIVKERINTMLGQPKELDEVGLLFDSYNNWFREFIIYYFHQLYDGVFPSLALRNIVSVLEQQITHDPHYFRVLPRQVWSQAPIAPLPPPPTITNSFETYIVEQHRAKLMPYLIKQYTDQKPRVITAMLYALEKLEVLTNKVNKCDQTNLHSALTITFGKVGGRTALNSALQLYDGDNIHSAKRQKIEQHEHKIKACLDAE